MSGSAECPVRARFASHQREHHGSSALSAGFEELVDALVRETEEFGGVSSAEPKIGQRAYRLNRLLLRLDACSLGCGACTSDVVGDRGEGGAGGTRPAKP